MTKEQFKAIGLDVDEIIGNAAIEWLANNTTIDTSDISKLSASAKLFIKKFDEVNSIDSGISSESIQGMSQSFNTSDKSALIWEFATELLGSYLKSPIKFVPAQRRFI